MKCTKIVLTLASVGPAIEAEEAEVGAASFV